MWLKFNKEKQTEKINKIRKANWQAARKGLRVMAVLATNSFAKLQQSWNVLKQFLRAFFETRRRRRRSKYFLIWILLNVRKWRNPGFWWWIALFWYGLKNFYFHFSLLALDHEHDIAISGIWLVIDVNKIFVKSFGCIATFRLIGMCYLAHFRSLLRKYSNTWFYMTKISTKMNNGILESKNESSSNYCCSGGGAGDSLNYNVIEVRNHASKEQSFKLVFAYFFV